MRRECRGVYCAASPPPTSSGRRRRRRGSSRSLERGLPARREQRPPVEFEGTRGRAASHRNGRTTGAKCRNNSIFLRTCTKARKRRGCGRRGAAPLALPNSQPEVGQRRFREWDALPSANEVSQRLCARAVENTDARASSDLGCIYGKQKTRAWSRGSRGGVKRSASEPYLPLVHRLAPLLEVLGDVLLGELRDRTIVSEHRRAALPAAGVVLFEVALHLRKGKGEGNSVCWWSGRERTSLQVASGLVRTSWGGHASSTGGPSASHTAGVRFPLLTAFTPP